jgi:Holliday junction resolvase
MQDVDDIIGDLKKRQSRKKGIHSKNKGNRGEREVAKIFNDHFGRILSENLDWGRFYKSDGSGARGHRHLGAGGQSACIGDLLTPDNFKFVIECKLGYGDVIDLNNAFYDGVSKLDEFLQQVEDDAERTSGKRKPMLIWRKDRQKHLVFLKAVDVPDQEFVYSMKYRDWTVISMLDLLCFSDDFFFELS